jgi:hypothetical protein
MRHSKIDLTMNVYTDPKLLDVAGAMDLLPALPLGNGGQTPANVLSTTGTEDSTPLPFAPTLAPTTGKTSTWQLIVERIADVDQETGDAEAVAASACLVKRKDPLTTPGQRVSNVRETGLEPARPCGH